MIRDAIDREVEAVDSGKEAFMFCNNLFLLFKLAVSIFHFFKTKSFYLYISKGSIEIDGSYLIMRLVNISFRIELP